MDFWFIFRPFLRNFGLFFDHSFGILVYFLTIVWYIPRKTALGEIMKRLINWHLQVWKEDLRRKPLMLRGARQVGKTYAVREFGKLFDTFVEVNLELVPEARTIFDKDLDPRRIVWELELLTKKTIVPGKTLLFFDEIQAAPKGILALRYFYELMPELHVIGAGSLLDFAIEKVGMPVGRVNVLYVYPLSFVEFLSAIGQPLFIDAILQEQSLSEVNHSELLDLLKQYFAIGGMPEIVLEWTQTQDPARVRDAQKQLIETYRQDFPKYANKYEIKYVETLFNQIPHFIGEQFKYSSIHGEYKKRELAPCLELLRHANVVHQIVHSAGHGIPLGATVNLEHFKMIFVDVGISQAILGLNLATWFLDRDMDLVNRGTIAEAFVGQELLAYASPKWKHDLYFWKRDAKGALAEVDYLYEQQSIVCPIEVKSGHGSTLRSLHQFLQEHPKSPNGIRFWSNNYLHADAIFSKPLYAVATLADTTQKEAMQYLK